MSRPAPGQPAGPPAGDLAAALELLARARRALARDALPEFAALLPLLEALRERLDRMRHDVPALRRAGLLALLDETGRLAGRLREEHGRLAVQLRETGVHRRAGAAYRRAGRL